jgi:hypothetical protein
MLTMSVPTTFLSESMATREARDAAFVTRFTGDSKLKSLASKVSASAFFLAGAIAPDLKN